MNLGMETETLEYKKSTGELKEAVISIASILYYSKNIESFGTGLKRIVDEYNGPAEPVRQFMLSQAPNSTEPHIESD